MAWGTGARDRTNTARHKRQRLRVLRRDGYRCQLRFPGCTGTATEMDHIGNVASGGSDDDANVHAVCHACHLRKTGAEAQAALAVKRARLRLPATPHPGQRP